MEETTAKAGPKLAESDHHERAALICSAMGARWRGEHALYALEEFRHRGAPDHVLRILAEHWQRLDEEAGELEQLVNEGTAEGPGVPLVLHSARRRTAYAREERDARAVLAQPTLRRGSSGQATPRRNRRLGGRLAAFERLLRRQRRRGRVFRAAPRRAALRMRLR